MWESQERREFVDTIQRFLLNKEILQGILMRIFDKEVWQEDVGIPGEEREFVDTIQSRFSSDFIRSCPARIDGEDTEEGGFQDKDTYSFDGYSFWYTCPGFYPSARTRRGSRFQRLQLAGFPQILSSPAQQGLMASRFQRISLKTFQLLLFMDIACWKGFALAGDKDGKREGELRGCWGGKNSKIIGW